MTFLDIKNNSSLFRLLAERIGISSAFAVIASIVITALLVFSLGSNLLSFEERVGAFPWLVSSDAGPEERIAIVSIDACLIKNSTRV